MISLNGAVDVSLPKTNQEKKPFSFVMDGQSIIFVTVSYVGSSYSGLQIFASPLLLTIKPTNAANQSAKPVNRIALTQLINKKIKHSIILGNVRHNYYILKCDNFFLYNINC